MVRGFGFVVPAGTDATDKSQHLYLSAHALRRAGIASVEKGARIEYRKKVSRHAGRKPECQDVRLIEAAE